MKHDTVLIPLKMIRVDKGAAKVVRWLNSHLETFTTWSCEGYSQVKIGHGEVQDSNSVRYRLETRCWYPPYVSFLCHHQASLDAIRRQVSRNKGVLLKSDVETRTMDTPITVHQLFFDDRKALRDFSRRLSR